MQQPLLVRALSPHEHAALVAEVRADDAVRVRRSQMVLASAAGEHTPAIAQRLQVSEQTVRNTLHAFNATGLDALTVQSCRPHTSDPAFDAEQARQWLALLHQSPRAFGHPTSVWTLALLAEVSVAEGITSHAQVSQETIRTTLRRLGVNWRRARGWLTSPDPAYAAKKGTATG
jgi:transposase